MADPVSSSAGFTWTSVGVWGSFLTLLGLLVRQWVPLRQLKKSADEKFRDELAARVTVLEKRLEQKDSVHAAEMAIVRHRLNNITQCFDALLLMIKTNPEKATEAAKLIEEMRARQIEVEAMEKATVAAANINAAARGDGE